MLVIKYVIPSYPASFGVNWGIANVVQSGEFSFLLSCENAGARADGVCAAQWRS